MCFMFILISALELTALDCRPDAQLINAHGGADKVSYP